MEKVSVIRLDLAKNVFQAHGADACGAVVFRGSLTRFAHCEHGNGGRLAAVLVQALRRAFSRTLSRRWASPGRSGRHIR